MLVLIISSSLSLMLTVLENSVKILKSLSGVSPAENSETTSVDEDVLTFPCTWSGWTFCKV